MALKTIRMNFTTDGAGDATVTATINQRGGLLYAVEWVDGDLVDGVDAVLSCMSTESGVDQTLLTLTDANNDAWYYPRTTEDDTAGAALTTTTPMVVSGDLQLVVSSGGATKTGAAIIYLTE